MRILISTNELLHNIRTKSHLELTLVPSEERYRYEVGTEKMDEVNRDIVESFAILQETLSRFLKIEEDLGDVTTDEATLPEQLILDFQDSERRTAGRGQTIADSALAYLTDATLARFYSSVSNLDLSEKHTKAAAASLEFLRKLFFTKLPPALTPVNYEAR